MWEPTAYLCQPTSTRAAAAASGDMRLPQLVFHFSLPVSRLLFPCSTRLHPCAYLLKTSDTTGGKRRRKRATQIHFPKTTSAFFPRSAYSIRTTKLVNTLAEPLVSETRMTTGIRVIYEFAGFVANELAMPRMYIH